MTSRASSFLAGIVLVGAVAALWAPNMAGPDICRYGYARSQRLGPAAYYPIAQEAYRRAGIPWVAREGHILDHKKPLCLGGTWDQSNLQIQTIADAAAKDVVERRACRSYCAGEITMEQAERMVEYWREP